MNHWKRYLDLERQLRELEEQDGIVEDWDEETEPESDDLFMTVTMLLALAAMTLIVSAFLYAFIRSL